jgi:hypothetical protein
MSDEEYTLAVSVGNKVAEDGRAGIIIWFEDGKSKCCVSAAGARVIAFQLLDWAEHAESWERRPDDERKRDWMILRDQPIDTMHQVKSNENPNAKE